MALTPGANSSTRSRWPMGATLWSAIACASAGVLACDAPSAPRVSPVAPLSTPANQVSERWFASYDIIDLGTLPGGQNSRANAIDDRGEVVGGSDVRGATSHGFLYSPVSRTMQDLGFVAAGFSSATGINARGVIVVVTNDLVLLPLDRRGRDLGIPAGWTSATGGGINSADDIVGEGNYSDGSIRAFEWRPGRGFRDLTSSLGRFSYASAINDQEEITGVASLGIGAQVAYVWRNGHVHAIGTLPGTNQSFGQAINNRGHVAGGTGRNDELAFAFFWSRDHDMRSLGVFPGDSTSQAFGMNDADAVVGISSPTHFSSGCVHPFIWTEARGLALLPTLAGFQGGTSCLYAAPAAINGAGEIAGTAELPQHDLGGFPVHAVLWVPRGSAHGSLVR